MTFESTNASTGVTGDPAILAALATLATKDQLWILSRRTEG